jgi:hypothetical protein
MCWEETTEDRFTGVIKEKRSSSAIYSKLVEFWISVCVLMHAAPGRVCY